jgi:Probable cobalt transporter subunit (CbtB)
MAVARTIALGTTAVPVNERLLGALSLAAGAILFYLVMLDHGQVINLLIGSGVTGSYLHELFHDGRHFGGAPCH